MTEKHYLLKVLGLSGIPKLVTFCFTLISFPLLIRALGATEYGVVLYIGAALGISEVLVDFGVSSASGKSMAAVRAHNPAAIRSEFFAWARLQAFFVCIGFVPMLLAAYLVIKSSPAFQDPTLLGVMAAAVGFNVVLNFIRPNLLSLLAFKYSAVLDTFESVIRSAGYFAVAFLFPTALGLAFATLATSVAAAALAVWLIWRRLSAAQSAPLAQGEASDWPGRHISTKSRIRESANFLWLRLSTRLFQEGPILIIERLSGADTVGIIGAFRKIIEIVSTPYLVIGNALAVRVSEIANKGPDALRSLWDSAFRITSTALLFAAIIFFAAEPLAHAMLPASESAPEFFAIMSILVIATTAFSLLAPMSDYLGGLFSRNILLTITAGLQLPIIWVGASWSGEVGVVVTYVAVNLGLAFGYASIAHRVLFRSIFLKVRQEVLVFSGIVLVSFMVATLLESTVFPQGMIYVGGEELLPILKILAFSVLCVLAVWAHKSTRRFYLNLRFFEFTPLPTSSVK